MTTALTSATVGALAPASRSDATSPAGSPITAGASVSAVSVATSATSPQGADGGLAVLAAHRDTVSLEIHDVSGALVPPG